MKRHLLRVVAVLAACAFASTASAHIWGRVVVGPAVVPVYAPVAAPVYYPPAYYAPGIAPVVVARPVVRPVVVARPVYYYGWPRPYVVGQPVRNVIRAVVP
jgi:hypothetical protein